MDQNMREIVTNVNFTSRTEGQTKINTIIWTVPRFLNLLENKRTRELRTDIKDLFDSDNSRFHLKMQFLGRDKDIIEVYYLSPDPLILKSILAILYLRNKQYEDQHYIVTKEFHTVQANKWQYLGRISKSLIKEGRNRFLPIEDSLRLEFQFIVSNDLKVEHITNVPKAQLSNDFECLLYNGLFSDVTMKSIEGTEFKVHKAVLASRSVVLKAHFEHNTTECHTNIVESPFEEKVLKEVLTFIYSDKAESVDDTPEKLLAAADYYQLSRLKSICEEALHKKLTVENAIETLQLADIHSAGLLKKFTLEFIKDGQAKLITKTEGWAKFKSFDLIKTLYEYITNDDVDMDIK